MATQTKIPPLIVSNPWWGQDPSDKQWLGLYGYEECPDLFYGGAAGPGKTSFLLMAAVQYVHYSPPLTYRPGSGILPAFRSAAEADAWRRPPRRWPGQPLTWQSSE